MKITDLKGQYVKRSARSLTCKNDDYKTLGVITGVTRFNDLPPREVFANSKIIRGSGLWDANKTENVYFKDGKLYYLFNLNSIEANKKYIEKYESGADAPDVFNEMRAYNEKENALAAKAAEFLTVIPCYFVM